MCVDLHIPLLNYSYVNILAPLSNLHNFKFMQKCDKIFKNSWETLFGVGGSFYNIKYYIFSFLHKYFLADFVCLF